MMANATVEKLIASIQRSKKAKRKPSKASGKRSKSLASLTATQRSYVRAVQNLMKHPHPDNASAINGYRAFLASEGVTLSDYVSTTKKRATKKTTKKRATKKRATKKRATKKRTTKKRTTKKRTTKKRTTKKRATKATAKRTTKATAKRATKATAKRATTATAKRGNRSRLPGENFAQHMARLRKLDGK